MFNSTSNRSKKLDELDGLVKNHGITLGTFGSEGSGYDTMMDFVRDFKILKKALLDSENLDGVKNKIEKMDKFLKELYEHGPNYLDLDNMRHFEKILDEAISNNNNNFGNRRRKRKVSKKPSASLKKLCKKHKIRLSVKRGSKRVPKSEKVLKKQLAKKMKTMKKKKAATKRKTVKRRRKRRSGYGSSLGMGPYPGSLMMRTPYFEMKA
tara:strand:+ start:108 stop:734 length:627 start_codon:yes stop_codon:yes gene_type:complete